jgi:hypothetical protein
MAIKQKIQTAVKVVLIVLVCLPLLGRSAIAPGDRLEKIRAFTRMIEFDYADWMLKALMGKNSESSINAPSYMTVEEQRAVVFEYFNVVRFVNQTARKIDRIYADPNITDHDAAAAKDNQVLSVLKEQENSLKPLAEAVLQHQVSELVAEMNLGLGGQPIPPVLYHSTRLPEALIISPRDVIRQEYNISLEPEQPTKREEQLENDVEKAANVSALVVPVGGVGVYPTMVMNTTDLNWLLEVIAHEWTHNFLTLRPLGMLYDATPELRTVNETTANIAGQEVGLEVLKRFYPELAPPDVEEQTAAQPARPPVKADPNAFSYRREMRKTRVQVDALLAEGKVEEAEEYMEERRRFFWDHGYQIRKLNQAYFAFYGAYNDQPGGGAAGSDPVGPLVQEMRQQSSSLADFLNRISWFTSFDALKQAVEEK